MVKILATVDDFWLVSRNTVQLVCLTATQSSLGLIQLAQIFMCVQHYGATSRREGTEYLPQCRKLLGISETESANAKVDKKSGAQSKDKSKSTTADDLEVVLKLMYGKVEEEKPYEPTWKCTKCGKLMKCLEFQLRPS
jgi:hypothetical protein